jgi:predicted nucleic acid-binding protein
MWVSRILATDSNHTAARTWLNRHIVNGGSLVAPELLAVEVAAAVGRQTGQEALARQYAQRLYTLPVMNLIPVDSALLKQATDLAAIWRLRAADAIYAAVAEQLAIPLVTFDGELLTRTVGVITTIRP